MLDDVFSADRKKKMDTFDEVTEWLEHTATATCNSSTQQKPNLSLLQEENSSDPYITIPLVTEPVTQPFSLDNAAFMLSSHSSYNNNNNKSVTEYRVLLMNEESKKESSWDSAVTVNTSKSTLDQSLT